MSPLELLTTRPCSARRFCRCGRTRKLTSAPASARRPPKYPPIAPAPSTRIRIAASASEGQLAREKGAQNRAITLPANHGMREAAPSAKQDQRQIHEHSPEEPRAPRNHRRRGALARLESAR